MNPWQDKVLEGPVAPKPYSYEHPRFSVAVDLVVFAEDEDFKLRVLLVRRGKDPFAGSWALPGGFVNMDETLAEAAVRECEEETGLRPVVTPTMLGVSDDPDRDPRGRVFGVSFAAVVDKVTDVRGCDDAAEAAWFPVTEVCRMGLAFDHNAVFDRGVEWLTGSIARYARG